MMAQIKFHKPIIGLSAYSGSGKTTLLEKLIPKLNRKGIRVAVIKHAHHSFDIDHPKKDSYKIRKAGAQQILISSQKRWALVHEHANEGNELTLEEALQNISTETIDLIIVEGFKAAPIPKIEVHRPSIGKPLIAAKDQHIIAIATDKPEDIDSSLPLLDLNQAEMIADYIEHFISKNK